MPLDTSIYNALLKRPKSVAEYDAEAMANQTNALGLQQGRMKMDEYQRSVADANKLRQVVSGFGADKGANYNALVGAGRLDEAQKYLKSNADIDKTTADAKESGAKTAKLDLEAVGLASQQHKDALTNVNDPQAAAAWVAAAYNDPRLAPISAHGGTLQDALARIPTDPAKFQEWKMQSSLGADKLIEYTRANANTVANNETSIATNAATNATSRANNAATNATTQRGQNMTDARQAETLKAGKVPSGYRAKADGTLEAIPGGPADPSVDKGKLTESQGKATLFVSRMDKADKIMSDIIASGTKTPALLAGIPGGNFTANADQQRLDQAQRDFVNAALRQESGAAISPSEFDSAKKQYFPQRGDSAAVIAQKAENRRTAIAGMGIMAGPGMAKLPTTTASVPTKNAKGWTLHTDASGNQAYVSPDGKQFQEVK